MNRTINSKISNHTLFVQDIPSQNMPNFPHKEAFSKFYSVRNFNKNGCIFMYLAKGHKQYPKQIVAWYPKGGFWSSYGETFQTAIEGAQRDGWLYA